MKKQKYDINKIYQKLTSNSIPQSYVDFIVSRCVTTCQSTVESKKDMATTASYSQKRCGYFGKNKFF